jgi:hypothetical protein
VVAVTRTTPAQRIGAASKSDMPSGRGVTWLAHETTNWAKQPPTV